MIIRSTTILCVRRDGRVAMGCDGQVTVGTTVMKHNAKKLRRLHHDQSWQDLPAPRPMPLRCSKNSRAKLEEYRGNLTRAAVELAKDWRTDRVLRRLGGVAGRRRSEHSFIISGTGDVVEPEDGILAIGSGGPYALAAARALLRHSQLEAPVIVTRSHDDCRCYRHLYQSTDCC